MTNSREELATDHQLDQSSLLEQEHVQRSLLTDVERGLDDVEAGRTIPIGELRNKLGK
jgi:hypothetical protein